MPRPDFLDLEAASDQAYYTSNYPPSKTPHPTMPSPKQQPTKDTKAHSIFYLAYGSNLSAETFLGKRGIRPLSYKNVYVPTLRLTFDLPGIPYSEPCFANSAIRDVDQPPRPPPGEPGFHKNRWKKPLVGVLYELTREDFAHVIQTEGGGAAYHDVVVDCYELGEKTERVPEKGSGEVIKGHTLFAPALPNPKPPNPPLSFSGTLEVDADTVLEKEATFDATELEEETVGLMNPHTSRDTRYGRPDPSYAQPSARYLKLLTDGAREHSLPHEYQAYLAQIRPYTLTTQQQRLGQFIFSAIWTPIIMFLFMMGRKVANKKGRVPEWWGGLMNNVFTNMWRSYDQLFNPLFGEGERTIGDKTDCEGFEHERVDGEVRAASDPVGPEPEGDGNARDLEKRPLLDLGS